ncbi:hypothetical protein N0V93_010063 [Gnomoniopsis smithogilvyi]|uniref:Uncharacterized protein n=1 Tax=Gnomoniopsis smithogilvyi TaxID=1191159 RepID=A0A9W8YJN1_9PEZI|nr:hypothetical protein N0V93_010063 [Gnomoniopsis smithogilvyi]
MSDSPPSTPKATTGIAALSIRETEILGKAWACLKTGPPEIDYEKLAQELSMANPRSASNAWSSIKKKMAWSATASSTPATAKSTATKRKKAAIPKAATADDEDDDEEENDSPAPKKKKTPARKKPAPKKSAPKSSIAAKDPNDSEKGAAAAEAQEHLVKDEPQVKAEPEDAEHNSADDVV